MRIVLLAIAVFSSINSQLLQPNTAVNVNHLRNQRISAQKCEEYSKITKIKVTIGSLSLLPKLNDFSFEQCEVSQGLIFGGNNAKPGEFPHMVAIGHRNNFKCSGSLISERYVLTAANCGRINGASPSLVRVGDLNLSLKEDLPEEDIEIELFTAHEQYNPRNALHDIAVARLAKSVKFSKYVRPACLAQPNIILKDFKVTATGWEYIENFGVGASYILQKLTLDLLRHETCSKVYLNYKPNLQICAGILTGGRGACHGDTGGPLQIRDERNKCIHIILGITSYGRNYCGLQNSPAVYTNIYSYLDWIERHVWGP